MHMYTSPLSTVDGLWETCNTYTMTRIHAQSTVMKIIFTTFDTEAVMHISLTTDAMQTCYNLLTVNGLRCNAELTNFSY